MKKTVRDYREEKCEIFSQKGRAEIQD